MSTINFKFLIFKFLYKIKLKLKEVVDEAKGDGIFG